MTFSGLRKTCITFVNFYVEVHTAIYNRLWERLYVPYLSNLRWYVQFTNVSVHQVSHSKIHSSSFQIVSLTPPTHGFCALTSKLNVTEWNGSITALILWTNDSVYMLLASLIQCGASESQCGWWQTVCFPLAYQSSQVGLMTACRYSACSIRTDSL